MTSVDDSLEDLPEKLNLGCGWDYRDGWHNVDIREECQPDEVVDLDEYPWPWEDDTFEHVRAWNVVEHVQDLHHTLNELHRIVSPGGTIAVAFPHPAGRSQWIDPTHEHTLLPETFQHELAPDGWEITHTNVSKVRFGRMLPDRWAMWWADHLGFLIDEIQLELEIVE
ncbi:hypothetical protein JCM18549_19830 [Halolamina salina]